MDKKRLGFAVAAGFLTVLAILCFLYVNAGKNDNKEKSSIRIGVTLYKFDDTFISTIRQELENCVKDYEQKTGIKVNMEIVDANDDQNTQNRQVERFIALNYDVLCVNMVDRSDASGIIDKAMAADIPVVFFNRQPVEEDMNRWEKLYYVGVDAKESAVLQGNILTAVYKDNPSLLDLNGDGEVSYVLLEGETSHQDSLIRTEWSIKTLKNGGVPIKKIAGGIANWERSQAAAYMEKWLLTYPEEIELVICNNDDMALGAIDAIEQAEDIRGIKLVGIDGTPPGIEAVNSGKLYGTVISDTKEYADVIFAIAVEAAFGRDVKSAVELKDGKYYWCTQTTITR